MTLSSEQAEAAPTSLLIAFAALWLAVTALLSVLGGWLKLASRYRDPELCERVIGRFSMRSISLRLVPFLPVNYGGCVSIRLTETGIGLSVFFLFRFLHPPLLIPWTDIEEAEQDSFLWFDWVEFILRSGGPGIRLRGGPAIAALEAWRLRRHRGVPAA